MANNLGLSFVDKSNDFYLRNIYDFAFDFYREAAKVHAANDEPNLATICVNLAKHIIYEQQCEVSKQASEGNQEFDLSAPDPAAEASIYHYDLLKEYYLNLGLTENAADCMNEISGVLIEKILRSGERTANGGADSTPPLLFFAQHRSASEYIRDIFANQLDIEVLYPTLGSFPRDYPLTNGFRHLSNGDYFARLHTDASDHLLSMLKENGLTKFIVHFRDPRQSLLSWIHHSADKPDSMKTHRLLFEPNIPKELPAWSFDRRSKWAIDAFFPGVIYWIESWTSREDVLKDQFDAEFTTFEDFAEDQIGFIGHLAEFYGVNIGNLEELMEDNPKKEHPNFRKGTKDEWRSTFTPDQKQQLWDMMPQRISDRFEWIP